MTFVVSRRPDLVELVIFSAWIDFALCSVPRMRASTQVVKVETHNRPNRPYRDFCVRLLPAYARMYAHAHA